MCLQMRKRTQFAVEFVLVPPLAHLVLQSDQNVIDGIKMR